MSLKERIKNWLIKKSKKNGPLNEKQITAQVEAFEQYCQRMLNGEIYGFSSNHVNGALTYCKQQEAALLKLADGDKKDSVYHSAFDVFSEDFSLNYTNAVYDYGIYYTSMISKVERANVTEDKRQVLIEKIDSANEQVESKKSEYDAILLSAEQCLNNGYHHTKAPKAAKK